MLTPVSCYYMTSFNYGGKKARDVRLTCRCRLSNIMPDSIFHDSMEWGMTQLLLLLLLLLLLGFFWFFFLGVIIAVFLSIEEMIQSDHFNTSGHGETLSYDGLRQMGSIIFQ